MGSQQCDTLHFCEEFIFFVVVVYLLVGYSLCFSKNDVRLYWKVEVMLSRGMWAELCSLLSCDMGIARVTQGTWVYTGSHQGRGCGQLTFPTLAVLLI